MLVGKIFKPTEEEGSLRSSGDKQRGHQNKSNIELQELIENRKLASIKLNGGVDNKRWNHQHNTVLDLEDLVGGRKLPSQILTMYEREREGKTCFPSLAAGEKRIPWTREMRGWYWSATHRESSCYEAPLAKEKME